MENVPLNAEKLSAYGVKQQLEKLSRFLGFQGVELLD